MRHFNCGDGNSNEMYIFNFGGDDVLIIDRLYVTPTGGSQIIYTISNNSNSAVCLSTEGTADGCTGVTVHGLVNLDTTAVDYTLVPHYDCNEEALDTESPTGSPTNL